MVLIPKGEFTMGSNEHWDEAKHQVVLDAYLIDKYETSNARYKEFMKATGHPAPAYWDDPRLLSFISLRLRVQISIASSEG